MFSLKGRIGRKEFLIRMVLLIIASLILNFISGSSEITGQTIPIGK